MSTATVSCIVEFLQPKTIDTMRKVFTASLSKPHLKLKITAVRNYT